jgi:hypothetical protein
MEFSFSLFSDVTAGKINCFGAVYPDCNGMQCGFGCETLKVKWGDIKSQNHGRFDLSVRGGQTRSKPTNMVQPRVEFNHKDDHGKAARSTVVEMYKKGMCYVEKCD